MALNVGLAVGLGVANFAGGLFQANQQRKSQQAAAQRQYESEQRAYANQAAQTAYKAEFEKLMIDQYNKDTVKEYDIKLDQYKQQLALNRSAAYGAFAAEQTRLNEQFAKADFTRASMIKELIQVEGAQAAAAGGRSTSRSLNRANLLNSLTEFGYSNMMLNKTLLSARFASEQKIGAIAGKHYQSDWSAYSKIQIPPRMRTPGTGAGPQLQSPVAALSVPGIGFGDVLSIGASSASSGLSAYRALEG